MIVERLRLRGRAEDGLQIGLLGLVLAGRGVPTARPADLGRVVSVNKQLR
jgi:hypothetical protein